MKLRNKKTGEIVEAESCNSATGMIGIFYEDRNGQVGTKDCFESLAELNKEWEDYKPAEPLIKDERICKAIKVWARLNKVEEVMFDVQWHSFRDMDMVISFLFSFRDFDCLEDGKIYTIAELCGEEEE